MRFPPNVAVSFCLASLIALCGCGRNEYVEPPPPTVTVAQPEQRSVTEYFELTGQAEAVNTIAVRARIEGWLREIHFEEGDRVEKDELLYTIEPAEYQATLARAEADVDRQQAALALAEARLSRLEEALKTRAVSEVEVLEARAERDVAAARLAGGRADRERAALDLSYTQIRSPIAGVVQRTLVDVGNLVGAGERTHLTNVIQLDPIYATFSMSERDVLEVAAAVEPSEARATIEELRKVTVDLARATDEDYPIEGKLNYIDAEIDRDTGTYLMRAIFDNPQPTQLLPGMFTRLRIERRPIDGALLVTERAFGSDQAGTYLLVVEDDGVVQQHRVEVGVTEDGMRVVESGLQPDDWVVVDGVLRARPGAKVTPQRQGEAANAGTATAPAAEAGKADAPTPDAAN